MRILVVDDDPPSVKMIAFLLREEGYEVVTADNGRAALEIVGQEPPDLVILDVMMPHIDGLEVTKQLRQRLDIPIIMLSAKGETSDKVLGLEMGADDYLAKPFEPTELLARVKAVLRRTDVFPVENTQTKVAVGDLSLDPVRNQVTVRDGTKVELTPIEFKLLHCLMRNAGRVLSHDVLLSTVWGYDYEGYSNQVAVYIRRLRTKLEKDPTNPKYITTVRGAGYKFQAE
jgi:DNA-binding response OmpR family regulator